MSMFGFFFLIGTTFLFIASLSTAREVSVKYMSRATGYVLAVSRWKEGKKDVIFSKYVQIEARLE